MHEGMVLNNVTTLAGSGQEGYRDGNLSDTLLKKPSGLALYPDGNILFVDSGNNRLRKISPNGTVSTLAGSGEAGFQDGNGVSASFNFGGCLANVTIDQHGDAFLSDMRNHCIRLVKPDGTVSTLAGTGCAGYKDGPAKSAIFHHPSGIAVDDDGNIFVCDANNFCIRKITQDGVVSTVAGSGKRGCIDGQGTAASFDTPGGLAVDSYQNLLVCDKNNYQIRKVSPSGEVITLAGNGLPGKATGSGDSACLCDPCGVAVDGDGNFIVADTDNHRILSITTNGTVSVIAGTGKRGFADGPGSDACFNQPVSVAVDTDGNVLVAEHGNHRICLIAAGLTSPLPWSSECTGRISQAGENIPAMVSKHMSNTTYSDIEIHVGERIFPAHRLILARFPFFEAAFKNKCVESTEGKIVLKDMHPDTFKLVLEYIYTDKVEIPVECDALALRSAAEFLGLPTLQQRCEIEIQKRLCVDNLAKCYRYAKVNSMNNLKRRCITIATKSITALASVQKTKDYVESSEDMKQAFLEECISLGK